MIDRCMRAHGRDVRAVVIRYILFIKFIALCDCEAFEFGSFCVVCGVDVCLKFVVNYLLRRGITRSTQYLHALL